MLVCDVGLGCSFTFFPPRFKVQILFFVYFYVCLNIDGVADSFKDNCLKLRFTGKKDCNNDYFGNQLIQHFFLQLIV